MRIAARLLPSLLILLLAATPAAAGDRDPSPAELAEMILNGNEAQHALVARWLEDADRETLRRVFSEIRARRATPSPRPAPRPPQPAIDQDAEKTMLSADIRIVDVDPAHAATLLGALRPTADRTWQVLTGAQVTDLLRAVNESKNASVISAPRILVEDGQTANVSVLDQVSYVKEFEIQVAEDGSKIADPVVAVIQDGLVIDLRGHVAPGGKEIGLEFTGTWAALKRPIPEFEQEVDGQTLTTQHPELSVTRARARATLPNDGWALIGGGATVGYGADAVERVALVNIRTVQGKAARLEDLGAEEAKAKDAAGGVRIRKK